MSEQEQNQIGALAKANLLLNKRIDDLHGIIGRSFITALEKNSEDRELRWEWSERLQQWDLKIPGGMSHATVWPNGTWHTWDDGGVGGENSSVENQQFYYHHQDIAYEAKREAWLACERQGFIPKPTEPDDEDPVWTEADEDRARQGAYNPGDWVYYGHTKYEVAAVDRNMVGIYDEPPGSHVDWLNVRSVTPTTPPDTTSEPEPGPWTPNQK